MRQAISEAQQWEQRCHKLESELSRERTIVSDLQNRLD